MSEEEKALRTLAGILASIYDHWAMGSMDMIPHLAAGGIRYLVDKNLLPPPTVSGLARLKEETLVNMSEVWKDTFNKS